MEAFSSLLKGDVKTALAGGDHALLELIMSGENFNPHVSTGVAPKGYLDKMLAEPFEPFTFSPAGAAVYQIGPFGTAAKKLKQLNQKTCVG